MREITSADTWEAFQEKEQQVQMPCDHSMAGMSENSKDASVVWLERWRCGGMTKGFEANLKT